MKPLQNWDKINEAGEFERLPAGVYGVTITKVVDNPTNEYLEVYCDITQEGKYKNYFKALTDAGLVDTSRSFRSYKTNAIPFFKAFITAIEKTNPGYAWDWDEQKLVGKKVMAVFGEEEYIDKNNEVKVGTKCIEFRSYEAFKEGRIKVPELRKLSDEEKARLLTPTEPTVDESKNLGALEIPDEELPF